MNQALMLLLSKVTLLILLGTAIAALLRGRSAATRHFVWSLTLFSTLTIAAAAFFAPPVALPIPYTPESLDGGRASRPLAAGVSPDAPGLAMLPGETPGRGGRAARPPMLAIIWLTGFLSVITWLVVGHIGLARIARSAIPVTGDEWRGAHGVRVAISAAVSAPVTWGWLRPLVLFPEDANEWPAERRRAALMHELAHVARRDYLIQILGALVCAAWWFHPLVWLAMHRLRRESEHAADDHVLSAGAEAPAYASHLLEVARGAVGRRLCSLPAVDMARPSDLESRIRAVLDDARTRSFVSPRVRLVAATLVTILLVPLAAAWPELRAAKSQFHPNEENVGPASPGETLVLDLEAGASVDIRGWDEPRVRVRSEIRGDTDARVQFDQSAGTTTVRTYYEGTKQTRSSSIRMEIRVPRTFDVDIESSGGSITIIDLDGKFSGNTGGGEIVLERVKGKASLTTGGGEIRVDDVDLDGHVSTGGGKVTLTRVRGGLTGTSGSGPVTSRKNDRLHVEKAGGEIELDAVPRGASISTGGGDITIGAGAGVVEANTGGGDIRIGPIAGSVMATTGAGRVEITLVDANGAEQSVDVTTGKGTVVLELPATLDARFDLETSYTVNFRRRTQIDSDWDLGQREETRELDAREGTPRRYVRARGVAGSGRGLIRVKAVNGDIFVRKGS